MAAEIHGLLQKTFGDRAGFRKLLGTALWPTSEHFLDKVVSSRAKRCKNYFKNVD